MTKQRVFTTRELAEYIKLNEKTIIKMAQNGELPGRKIGNQWRFHEASIDLYLQKKIITSTDDQIDSMIKNQLPVVQLSRLISSEIIDLKCRAKSRQEILMHLAQMAENTGLTVSAPKLASELEKREDLLSTGLGNGIAIPHPRNPSKRLFSKPALVVAYCPKGIDFKASDNKKVKLFMMICAPDEVSHLKILAHIAKLLNKVALNDKMDLLNSPDDLMRLLIEFDQDNIFNGK
jgi:PTS system nitrogen regulatory IIA component